ncbi:KIR protein [Plasmodium knowlesi strain H]|uniref:KIR protein n=3 Tax=Plasmodium knowlesi TaxID=5850 RepID=A0A5K1U4U4_PLAKH|nr:KIR protein [Plasmodium knowlesi strain H]OTN68738.1 KIR protein [Plasmodium knowlesi]CAA9986113.1 KIR protein [Plasmodium knowlesi strain H]SBO25278.1 KIR protein [Plasmodium knowlesi strain H]SBO27609.1 KIR protein [Plasmodium knowlesi strain H]VVS75587.1 KIR protein [Plasmodium knowlesi strain H]|eukprot:XP_002257524.1 KIR protein [Plasmodium knowlesi strain H]
MTTANGILTEGCVNKLPSRQMYKKLEGDGQGKCDEEWDDAKKVRMQLKSYNIPENACSKIMSTLCYIERLRRSSSDNGIPEEYKFFYYHVGDILLRADKDSMFEQYMDKVSSIIAVYASELSKHFWTPDSTVKVDFPTRKTVFDYYKDKNTIQDQLNGGKQQCNAKYHAHLEAIEKAYETEHGKCSGNRSSDWCTKFKTYFPDYETDGKDSLDLKCEQVDNGSSLSSSDCALDIKNTKENEGATITYRTEETPAPELDSTSSSTSSSHQPFSFNNFFSNENNMVTLSSAMAGTVAIPLIGSLLYKYTDIFDGIKNSLFGGSNNTGGRSRGRRSTFQHNDQHFDGLDSSTMGDDSSTLGGSSTDISTIYNDDDGGRRRPTGRGRTQAGINNGRPGNIRYYAT